MKKVIVSLLMLLVLCGFNMDQQHMWNDDGDLKEEYARQMQRSWCEYNKGEDFAKNQCQKYWESE